MGKAEEVIPPSPPPIFPSAKPQRVRRFFRLRFPSPGRLFAFLSLFGLVALSYLLGAAVMFFEWPTSAFLEKAFLGGEAWYERTWPARSKYPSGPARLDAQKTVVTADRPDRTWDGFTLITTTQGPWATLIDMRGRVVHQWQLPFRRAWPAAAHVRDPLPDDRIHWFRCYLYPNGDLLAVYHGDGDTPYGYGLAKLDKDSKLLWKYDGHVHHDVAVRPDGTIYTLTQKIVTEPPDGLEGIRGPYLADYLVVLSPQGRELQTIPLLEAFRDSPYAQTLSLVTSPSPRARANRRGRKSPWKKGDILHANSVRVLGRGLAGKFPLFKRGQVLISFRSLDTIAVLDVPKRKVVWAAQGLWRAQHDAEFLANGRILVFDNLGSLGGTRVLEYDPLTQATPWSYAGEGARSFLAVERGAKQRLPNGNTLILDPDGGRLFEVTRDKKLAWECFCPAVPVAGERAAATWATLTGGRRYRAGELTFLKGVSRSRP
jgi:hypothetical protein